MTYNKTSKTAVIEAKVRLFEESPSINFAVSLTVGRVCSPHAGAKAASLVPAILDGLPAKQKPEPGDHKGRPYPTHSIDSCGSHRPGSRWGDPRGRP